MSEFDRRKFLIGAGAAAAMAPRGAAAAPRRSPNDTLRGAVIGVRGRGNSHLGAWLRIPGVELAAICDVDEAMLGKARKRVAELAPRAQPALVTDLRRLFDDKSIDFVSIATPDHWHALASIWACQAGKDVYVEKPVSHNVWEGRKMVEAARKHKRIVAAGMQNRSNAAVRAAMKFLHEGGIGDVYMAKGLCFKPRDSIGRKKDGPVPAGVNYDLWLGPAPQRPFNENRFHYNWHWFWDYGCTDLGNQGPHQMDIARWGMNRKDYPKKIHCSGGYFAFDSDQETPNTQLASLEFADGKILQFEVRGLYTNSEDDIAIGNLFFGSKGWMHLRGSTWKTYFGHKNEPGPSGKSGEDADNSDLVGSAQDSHFDNFIRAVRSRKTTDLTADIEDGHVSSAYCHLANIAYRVGRQVVFDGKAERFANDEDANKLLTRRYRAPYVIQPSV